MREKDQIVHEKYSLEQDLQVIYLKTVFKCVLFVKHFVKFYKLI